LNRVLIVKDFNKAHSTKGHQSSGAGETRLSEFFVATLICNWKTHRATGNKVNYRQTIFENKKSVLKGNLKDENVIQCVL